MIIAGAGFAIYKYSDIFRDRQKKASELKFLDETWNLYTNYKLGFSIKVPKKIFYSVGSCPAGRRVLSYFK